MSDLRDAAELALTALENTCPNNWTSVKENLRKALAQPEHVHAIDISQERVDETEKQRHECPEWDFMEIDKDSPEFDACLCFPKPSLWLAIAQDGRVKYTTDSGRASDWKKSGSYRLVRDYYTTPPKREWVGLTDKEMDKAMEYWSDKSRSSYGGAESASEEYVDMVSTWRYIEAKLKEKNT